MLNVWKKLFTGNSSEKRVLPQKVALETLSPVLTTLLTIFRQKSNFSTKFWKTPPPPPLPPFLKKNIKLNTVPEINFFQEKFIWAEKDTILTICFQTSKNICRMSRKSLENSDSTKKKDRLPKKHSRFAPSSFDNHAETFQKQYVILLLNFTKTKSSISKKSYPIA